MLNVVPRYNMKSSNLLCWGWFPFGIILCLVLARPVEVSGFFHIGVETLNRPAIGEPVNVQIIVDPLFGDSSQNASNKDSVPSSSEEFSTAVIPSNEANGSSSSPHQGLSRRRGIFNLPSLELSKISPATINFQIPGKLPFNPLEIFNVQTFKSFVQSVTDNLMGTYNNKHRGYKTGFDDSVTIISEDPEKPVTSESSSYGRSNSFRSGREDSPHAQRLRSLSKNAPTNNEIETGLRVDGGSSSESAMIDQQVETLNEVLKSEMKHGKDPHYDHSTASPLKLSFLPDLSALGQLFNWGEQSARSLAVCNACRVAFGLFVIQARQGANLTNLMDLATFGCTFFRITSSEMCTGLVASFGPIFHYMVMHKRTLNGDTFCGISLQSSGCTTSDPDVEWRIDLNQYNGVQSLGDFNGYENGQEQRRRYVQDFRPQVYKGDQTLKILHLTDIHLDPSYQIGAMNECENELCCHVQNGQGTPGKRAGYYGDYGKCDLPFHSYINALEHISSTHPDIKIIYLTGDFVPHNIWTTSVSKNMEILVNASRYIRDYFPDAKVIPVIGNHETHPVNMFSPFGVPSEFSTDWLYSAASKAWAQWLPKESIHNFLHAGFYDVEIDPYFRVLVLNTNLCYGYNFWQAFEHRDPSGQLRWLARELQKSEDLGQFVHILGHMAPTESDCWIVWAQNFHQIINRYKNTIKAQFYGHTHFDEFKLYYNVYNRSEAISPAWVGASLTPFTDLNPGYKIFTVDGDRGSDSLWDVLEHETWIYNLTEANLNPYIPPRWFKLYKATEAFELADLSPNSLHQLVVKMSYNGSAFDNYYRLYHKNTDTAIKPGCDLMCRKRVLCGIVTPTYEEYKTCLQLKPKVAGVILPPSIFTGGAESLKRGSASETTFQRVISFGRNLFKAFG